MSIYVMSQVWKRLPAKGPLLLLALALADHADDAGESIFPSIKSLADKTRQSERTVQAQLLLLKQSGWLLHVRDYKRPVGKPGSPGYVPGRGNEYRIDPSWLAGRKDFRGADFATSKKPVMGANEPSSGVQNDPFRGAAATAPESSLKESSKESSMRAGAREADKFSGKASRLTPVTCSFCSSTRWIASQGSIRWCSDHRQEADKALGYVL